MCGSKSKKNMVYWSSCNEEVKSFILKHLAQTEAPGVKNAGVERDEQYVLGILIEGKQVCGSEFIAF